MKKRQKKSGTDFTKKVEEVLLSGKPVKCIVGELSKLIQKRKREEARQMKAQIAEVKQQLDDIMQEIEDATSFIREERMRTIQEFDQQNKEIAAAWARFRAAEEVNNILEGK